MQVSLPANLIQHIKKTKPRGKKDPLVGRIMSDHYFVGSFWYHYYKKGIQHWLKKLVNISYEPMLYIPMLKISFSSKINVNIYLITSVIRKMMLLVLCSDFIIFSHQFYSESM